MLHFDFQLLLISLFRPPQYFHIFADFDIHYSVFFIRYSLSHFINFQIRFYL
jgi:hypothetical protein